LEKPILAMRPKYHLRAPSEITLCAIDAAP
jgi:hypothetical protein